MKFGDDVLEGFGDDVLEGFGDDVLVKFGDDVLVKFGDDVLEKITLKSESVPMVRKSPFFIAHVSEQPPFARDNFRHLLPLNN